MTRFAFTNNFFTRMRKIPSNYSKAHRRFAKYPKKSIPAKTALLTAQLYLKKSLHPIHHLNRIKVKNLVFGLMNFSSFPVYEPNCKSKGVVKLLLQTIHVESNGRVINNSLDLATGREINLAAGKEINISSDSAGGNDIKNLISVPRRLMKPQKLKHYQKILSDFNQRVTIISKSLDSIPLHLRNRSPLDQTINKPSPLVKLTQLNPKYDSTIGKTKFDHSSSKSLYTDFYYPKDEQDAIDDRIKELRRSKQKESVIDDGSKTMKSVEPDEFVTQDNIMNIVEHHDLATHDNNVGLHELSIHEAKLELPHTNWNSFEYECFVWLLPSLKVPQAYFIIKHLENKRIHITPGLWSAIFSHLLKSNVMSAFRFLNETIEFNNHTFDHSILLAFFRSFFDKMQYSQAYGMFIFMKRVFYPLRYDVFAYMHKTFGDKHVKNPKDLRLKRFYYEIGRTMRWVYSYIKTSDFLSLEDFQACHYLNRPRWANKKYEWVDSKIDVGGEYDSKLLGMMGDEFEYGSMENDQGTTNGEGGSQVPKWGIEENVNGDEYGEKNRKFGK